MKQEYIIRIVICILSQVIYNLMRKYLSKLWYDTRVLVLWLYVFATTIGAIVFFFFNKQSLAQISSLWSRKLVGLLLIASWAIYMFQYSSLVMVKTSFSMTSFRLITSIWFIVLLFLLDHLINGDAFTSHKIIGILFGLLSIFFLMK